MKTLKAESRKMAKKMVKRNWSKAIFLKNNYESLTPEVMVLATIPSMKALSLKSVPASTVVSRGAKEFTIIEVPRHFSKLLRIADVNVIQNFFVSEFMLGRKNVPMSVVIKRRICQNRLSFIIDYTPYAEEIPYTDIFEKGYYLKIGTPKSDWGDHNWEIASEKLIALKEIKKV